MKTFSLSLLALILIVAAGFAGAYYGKRHPLETQNPSPTPTAASEASPTPSPSLTYTEATTGFTIQYPEELTLSSSEPNFPVPGTNVHGQAFSFPSSYADTTNLVEASITATSEDGGQTVCAKPIPDASATPGVQTVIIKGNSWLLSTGSDHGAGQTYGYRSYSMASGTVCYRIFLSTHSANIEPKSQLPAFDEAHFESVLTDMVESFRLR